MHFPDQSDVCRDRVRIVPAAIPLGGLPIPPIDNVHVLHFGTDASTRGRYTVHMYFIPEEVYLAWEAEPSTL